MMTKKFRVLNPRLDPNFKAIFTQKTKESNNALKSFLTAAIGRTVEKVTVAENDEPKEFDSQRGISYDINCTFDDGTCSQIEMQGYDRDYDYGKRAEYYVSRLLSSTLDVGDDWDKIPKSYQISVLNFKFDKTNDNPIHYYTMLDPKDGAKLADRLNVIFIELPKIPEFDENTDIKNLPTIIKWCKFILDADNPEKQGVISKIAESEEGIMAAENTLSRISQDRWRWIIQGQIEGRERDIRSGYHAAERRGMENGLKKGMEKGLKQGIEQGLQQGERKAKIETARNAFAMHLTPEQIVQLTGLSITEVQQLQV